MRLNFSLLNTTAFGPTRLNNNVMKRGIASVVPPTPSRPDGLIAQYKPYLNSNDSPTREILKDYSGNGHDIQLYNFAFAENSGYGKFLPKFSKSGSNKIDDSQYNIGIYKLLNLGSGHGIIIYGYPTTKVNIKFNIINIPDGVTAYIKIYDSVGTILSEKLAEGLNTINTSFNKDSIRRYLFIYFDKTIEEDDLETPVIIQFLPEHPGALVSDGVDDYGLCDNFPILTKEKGYTIVALRRWINEDEENSTCLVTKTSSGNGDDGEFMFEYKESGGTIKATKNFLGRTALDNFHNELFTYQNSIKYNETSLSKGEERNTSKLAIFRFATDVNNYYGEFALYTFEIYNRDLTDEEVENVHEAMYEELLTATNALQNHIIADYECYDKTNEDEDRDVLKDLSGNGHDIQLYNFGFAEGSGYGLYRENWKNSGANGVGVSLVKTYNSISVSVPASYANNFYLSKVREVGERVNLKILVSGIPEGVTLEAGLLGAPARVFYLINGINTIDITRLETDGNRLYFTYRGLIDTPYTITVKEIPEYQGALVSDGVDDYGLCTNFPTLPIDEGFTVLAIRKWINKSPQETAAFLSTRGASSSGPFVLDKINIGSKTENHYISYGNPTVFDLSLLDTDFVTCTSVSYYGNAVKKGDNDVQDNILNLFCGVMNGGQRSSVALYAIKVLNKDCTTEEIKFIAKQMADKHKKKTGETIELNF